MKCGNTGISCKLRSKFLCSFLVDSLLDTFKGTLEAVVHSSYVSAVWTGVEIVNVKRMTPYYAPKNK